MADGVERGVVGGVRDVVDNPAAGPAPTTTGTSAQVVESSRQVAGVARDQAAGVASEVGDQARDMLERARAELGGQASTQQQRLVAGLRSVGDELSSMTVRSEQSGAVPSGAASEVARQLSQAAYRAAGWLEGRDPADVLADVRGFARRRPGTFLAVSAAAGLVAGRLTRGIASSRHSGEPGRPGREAGNGVKGSAPWGSDTAPPERTATAPPSVDIREFPAGADVEGLTDRLGTSDLDERLR